MLGVMTALMFHSSWDDTATSDDNVALISGYSYLRTQEYRLEPQNPPLIKDLAAVPLLFMNLHEPWQLKDWVVDKEPDTLGRAFLYQLGNDADSILRAARTPMILFSLAFGALLFWWTRRHYGDAVALLTLFFYAFSPTVIAHSRFVATDLGATAGFFVGLTAFLSFLKAPTTKNTLLAGAALGFALLVKFSTIALLPIFLLLAVVWSLVQKGPSGRRVFQLRDEENGRALVLRFPRVNLSLAIRSIGKTAAVIAVAFLLIYVVYLHHVWNYAPKVQREVAELYRGYYDLRGTAKTMVLWASEKPLLQPWAEYFLGLLVALKASRLGQPVFFLGKSYSVGIPAYFPVAYLLKEPLALHVMTLAAIVASLFLWRPRIKMWGNGAITRWIRDHFTEFAFLVMLAVYWSALIRSHINIGVRHLLPAFPIMFILVAKQMVAFIEWLALTGGARVRTFACIGVGVLLAWQALTVVRVHPSYMAYFNELAGGPENGWKYLNDSNLDWGQDVKRLAQFIEAQGATELHADYFGPVVPQYYFPGKYKGSVGCGAPPKGWVAVSAMLYPGAPWNVACDYRRHLPIETARAKIGHSIFVFYVE